MLRKRHNGSIQRADSQQAVKSPPLLVRKCQSCHNFFFHLSWVQDNLTPDVLLLQDSPDPNREQVVKLSVSISLTMWISFSCDVFCAYKKCKMQLNDLLPEPLTYCNKPLSVQCWLNFWLLCLDQVELRVPTRDQRLQLSKWHQWQRFPWQLCFWGNRGWWLVILQFSVLPSSFQCQQLGRQI